MNKKISYIANVRLPTEKAHGIQIIRTCISLAKNKVDVTLIIPFRYYEGFNTYNKIKELYNIPDNLKIKVIPLFDHIKYEDKTPKILKNIFFLIQRILFSISALSYALIKGYRIIYTRDIFTIVICSIFRYIFSDLKCFFEIHFIPKKDNIFKYFISKASGIISISDYLSKWCLKYNNNVITARDGFDKKIFFPLKNKINNNKFIVLYCGHLYKWKGVDTLCRSIKYIEDKDIIIKIAGGTEKLINEYKKIFSNERIKFLGFISQNEVADEIRKSDIAVLPNSALEKISKYYTSPLKLFEYMACRKAIISTDIPSLKEILEHKVNSYIVKADSSEDIAKAIIELKNNSKLCDKISKQAYLDSEKYSWNKRANIIKKMIF